MKKFKNIIYIAILSLLVVSCEDNTESVTNPGEFSGDGITEVKVGFTDNNLSTELTEGEKVTYSIGMPIKIKGDVKVSINIYIYRWRCRSNLPIFSYNCRRSKNSLF